MPNPYPAEFWGPSRDARALVVRLGGYVNFTDNANQPGIGSVVVTDGVHTVSPASEISFTGATVTDQGGGVAGVAIAGGGSGLTVQTFPFTFATASLNAGVDTGIAVTSGKALIWAAILVTTPFNGTTPLGDFGVGVTGGQTGLNQLYNGSTCDMTTLQNTGAGIKLGTLLTGVGIWTSSGNIGLWVSRDGTKGGTASGATAGAATLYVLQTT